MPFVLQHWKDARFIIAGVWTALAVSSQEHWTYGLADPGTSRGSGHLRNTLEHRAAELNVEASVTFSKALGIARTQHRLEKASFGCTFLSHD